ncbi:MAG TPA: alpha-amylase family glycosyl hydrolase [Polyangia bacterium]
MKSSAVRSAFFLGLLALASAGCGDASTVADGGLPDGGGTTPIRSCAIAFSFSPGQSVKSIGIGAEWNQFDPTKTPMTGPDASGAWHASVPLPPGAYGYKYVLTDGAGTQTWILDPQNPYSKYVGTTENSLREVDDCQNPSLTFLELDKSASGALHAEVQYADGAGQAGLDPAALKVLLDGAQASGVTVDATGKIVVDASGLSKDKHRLTFQAADRAGHAATQLDVPFWIEDQPFDFRDGMLYFVFTDRFKNGTTQNDNATSGVDARANYQGGDFAGVQQEIEAGYFDSLGVRTIWISPPNANPDHGELGTGNHLYTGYHGYWPISGRDIQPRFGDLTALKAMVAAAHKRGIRVIVDSVLNHVHIESPYFVAHQHDGWFNGDGSCVCGGPNCDWTVHAIDCWFEPYLPDINYENYDALKTMVDDAIYWAREADVDGFRVDAVKQFLPVATRRLRSELHDQLEQTGPLYYLVGETFDGDRGLVESYVGQNELTAQFDFPLYFTVRAALADYSTPLGSLEQSVKDSAAAYGSAPMSPFLGNQDVPRFLTEAAVMLDGDPSAQAWNDPPAAPTDDAGYQKLMLAQTFVSTQPGVPLIYYGDEYGQPGAADPDNRRFMKWSGYTAFEQETLDHQKRLGQAREELVALRRGGTPVTMWIDDNLYVYARVSGTDVAVVAINREWNPRTVSVPVAPGVPLPDGTVLRDRLGGPSVTVTGQALQLNLPAHSSALYAP